MNQILTADPRPLDEVDPALARIVHHCLEKNPGERFQSARDLAFHLEGARQSSDVRAPAGIDRPRPRRAVGISVRRWLPWARGDRHGSRGRCRPDTRRRRPGVLPRETGIRRFSLPMSATPLHAGEWPPLAVSPDGRRLAYVVRAGAGAQIVVRDLDALTARAIPGTDNGFAPFFSPDGEHLGFFTSDSLMRVALVGGPPARLTSASPVSRGAVWTDDGRIYFARSQSGGIFRIAADGGVAEPVTNDAALENREGHVWPDVSPDGAFLLYVARRGDSFDEARIVARSLRTGQQRTVIEGGTYARVAPDGRIVFARGAAVYAVEFDPVALAPRGLAQPILNGVQMDPLFGGSYYGVARDGTLVYVPGDARPPGRTLLWATPSGAETAAFPEERPFLYPAISPDGNRRRRDDRRRASGSVAVRHRATGPGPADLARRARISAPSGRPTAAVWPTPPFGRGRPPPRSSSPPTASMETPASPKRPFPNAWTRDGDGADRHDATNRGRARAERALRRATRPGECCVRSGRHGTTGTARRSARTGGDWRSCRSRPAAPRSSSAPADAADARQASVGGGTSPVWARDGRTLFYRNGDAVMSVAVGAGSRPSLALPRLLFRGRFEEPARPDWPRNYDVAPDGRFLMIRQTYTPTLPELVVVLGWRGQTLLSSPE